MQGRGWGRLVQAGRRAGAGPSKGSAAHQGMAPEEGVNCEAEKHIRKVMLAAHWMWAGCTPAFKIMGNSFSRAALEFRNTAPYTASGFRCTVEDKKV